MNRKSTIRWIAFILVFGLVAGCLPYVHSDARSADVRGRVLDARTHLPIKDAEIRLAQDPPHATHTDAYGYFHMKATRNWHYLTVTPGADWPDNKDGSMIISHTNYTTVGGTWRGDVGDFLLKPKP
jgi:hypothetical protein